MPTNDPAVSRHHLASPNINVRRLAAVDMHGAHGTRLRRRVIVVEFVLGVLGGTAFGLWVLLSWPGAVGLVVGSWLLGLAVNYLPLAIHALALTRPGALDAELRDVDLASAFRNYNVAQFWIFVPGIFAILALFGRPRVSASRR